MPEDKFPKLIDYAALKQQFGEDEQSCSRTEQIYSETTSALHFASNSAPNINKQYPAHTEAIDDQEHNHNEDQDEQQNKRPGLTGSRLRSYAFAVLTRKEYSKNDLIEKNYFSEIRLKKNPEHKYIFRKLEDNNYRKIAEKIYEDCKLSKPLNQEFRDFLRQDSKNSIEVFLKDSILDLYKNSNYEFNKTSFEKNINLEKINEIYLVLQKEIEKYEKDKLKKLKTTKLINEKEIRKEIRGINLTYEEFEEKVGKSISHICFENNAKFMKENCKERDLGKLKEEISSLNETLSENYISNIAKKIIIEDEIQLRLGKTFKQESIEESKEEKKEEIREIYEESEKEKFEKIEITEVIK